MYSTEKRLEKHEKEYFDHDDCSAEMPNKDNKILKYNHGEKLLKVLFMIYVDLECLLEKRHSCQIILKNLTQRKKLTYFSFDASEKELGYFRGKGCMEKFCKDLRENVMKILNYEKKKRNDTNNG